jgi:RHS repeat-associated protein
VRYSHRDRLGSVTAITDEAGNPVEKLSYDVWGKRRNGDGSVNHAVQPTNPENREGFTEHEHLDAIGLVHMNGRIYDPTIARFMSADPTVPDAGDTQNFNRYSYVLNNPTVYTDPSGFAQVREVDQSQQTPRMGLGGLGGMGMDGMGMSLRTMFEIPSITQQLPPVEVIGKRLPRGCDRACAFAILAAVYANADRLRTAIAATGGEFFDIRQIRIVTRAGAQVVRVVIVRAASGTVVGAIVIAAAVTVQDVSNMKLTPELIGQMAAAEMNRGGENDGAPLDTGEVGADSAEGKSCPNPDGCKGKPDHQDKVDELERKAQSEAGPNERVVRERKVQGHDSNRRPDVQIVDENGRTRQIYEAERRPESKRNRDREAEYDRLRIPNQTFPLK